MVSSSSASSVGALALGLVAVWARTPLPLAAGTALVTLGRLRGHVSAPNLVTAGRLLVVVAALAFAWREPRVTVPAFFAAWVLDGLDGWLARRRGQATSFGALLDQETDASLVFLLCVELVVARGVGAWVLLAGALRYLLVLARLLARGPIPERRSSLGRAIFSFSYLSLLSGLWPALDAVSWALMPAAVAALVFSFTPDFVAVARARCSR